MKTQRIYRGVELNVESKLDHSVTVETIKFQVDGQALQVMGAYGWAQVAAERIISKRLGKTLYSRLNLK